MKKEIRRIQPNKEFMPTPQVQKPNDEESLIQGPSGDSPHRALDTPPVTRVQPCLDRSANKVLLIESDPTIAKLIRDALTDARYGPFSIEWATTLCDGLERLKREGIGQEGMNQEGIYQKGVSREWTGAIMLNLSLTDSEGLDTLEQLLPCAGHIPILILSDAAHEDSAQQAILQGAQDYFLTSHIDGYSLSHVLRNLMARKEIEEALFIEKERAQVTLNSIGDAVISVDLNSQVTYLNLVAEQMTGWLRDEAAGRPLTEVLNIIDGATREPACSPVEWALLHNEPAGLNANAVLVRRDGFESPIEDSAAPIHDRDGNIIGAVMVFHDVSKARALMLKMSHLAQHDFLTDLPNRVLLNDRLEQAIARASRGRNKKQSAVLFLDLDLFKDVNDSLGHLVGDKLLLSVTQRLLRCVRSSDTVSRQGGDEFVILLQDIDRAEDAARSAQHILAAFAAPHLVEGHDLTISVSMGISLYPSDGDNAETLIKHADAAMYHAKHSGRNNYRFFQQAINDGGAERCGAKANPLEANLRRAVTNHELLLHYQPIVDLSTNEICAVEALIRWQHPQRGLLLPGQFIPMAEDSGMIVPVGQWVLREACGQIRAWLDEGLRPSPVAVNISAVEFRNPQFLPALREILTATGLTPDYLQLELTESVLMHDHESATTLLRALKELGIGLAIDDFGTGFSSLSYLKRFPISMLKIDQSFVRDINTDPDDATIVSAVIGMAHSLNKGACAEGVETSAQLAALRAEQCGSAQGYYFSPPLATEQYAELLKQGMPEYLAATHEGRQIATGS